MRNLVAGVVLVFLAANARAASDLPSPAPKAQAYGISVGSQFYPRTLADEGVHGTVLLDATISAEGKLEGLGVAQSSGSEALDAQAIAAAGGLSFKPRTDAKPLAIRLPVDFMKDSVSTLPDKTCADFNLDAAFFRKGHPQADIGEMLAFKMSSGLIFTMKLTQGPPPGTAYFKRLKAMPAQVATQCAAHPEAKFLAYVVDALK